MTRDGWACTEVCGHEQRWVNVRGRAGCDHRCQGVSTAVWGVLRERGLGCERQGELVCLEIAGCELGVWDVRRGLGLSRGV